MHHTRHTLATHTMHETSHDDEDEDEDEEDDDDDDDDDDNDDQDVRTCVQNAPFHRGAVRG